MRSRTGLVALVIVVLAGAVACTSDSAGRSSAPAAPTTTAADHATHPSSAPVAANASPTQLRAQFEQLLGQHALLAMRLTRSQVSKTSDFQQVAEASLQHNSDALSQLVETAYDDTQGDRFQQLWQGYVTDLSTYASAAASQDASAKQQARADLMAYCDAYGSWLATASNGQVQPDDAVRTARTRVMGLMRQVDAYAARDYSQAYKLERDTYQATFTAGATLTKASVTPTAAAKLDTPARAAALGVRHAAGRAHGADHRRPAGHLRRGDPSSRPPPPRSTPTPPPSPRPWPGSSAPRRRPSSRPPGPTTSRGCWPTRPRSPARTRPPRKPPRRTWSGFGARLALYFSDIVRNELPVEALTDVLGVHDKHLIEQVNAYAADDYAKAEKLQLEGYQQMLGVANTLVGAIQRTVKPGCRWAAPRPAAAAQHSRGDDPGAGWRPPWPHWRC